ncbi:MAG: hypothetical protein ACI87N_003738 [Flavobacteriales bacterium]|jgi:hypothetical protein
MHPEILIEKIKKIQLVLLLFCLVLLNSNILYAQCESVQEENLTNPGPFEVETLTELDGIRNGPDYLGATIYYPTNGTPPYASIAIVPGYVSYPSSVASWGPFYASHGIVTIIIGTNSIYDYPEDRAIALLDALETIKQENRRTTSPLEGALNLDQLAVSGWSMGGGGAQRAAVLDNSISGVVALCPWLPNPKLEHQSPVLIFSGENDTVAPPSEHADIHYAKTSNTTDRALFEIANGNHYVANTPNGGGGAVGKIALSWLQLYVAKKECYCSLLTDNLLADTPVASKIVKDFECASLGINKERLGINLYPNPVKNNVNLDVFKDVHYKLFSPFGQSLLEGKLTGNHKQIDLSQLPASIYFLQVEEQTIKLLKYN